MGMRLWTSCVARFSTHCFQACIRKSIIKLLLCKQEEVIRLESDIKIRHCNQSEAEQISSCLVY